MITQELLKQFVNYDPETGIFIRIRSKIKASSIGKPIGYVDAAGYIGMRVLNKLYRAHRLAWIYMYGYIPPKTDIDHKNGIKSDNRISNLRLASRQQNAFNTKRSNKTSKVIGVTPVRDSKTWRARAMINGKQIHIGTFKTKEEAHIAYQNFVKPLHSEFYVGNRNKDQV